MADLFSIANLVLTAILAALTATYVVLTRRLLKTAVRQSRLASNPVVGVRVKKIFIGEKFGPGRQDLGVDYELINLTDAPAIAVTVDGEIILKHSAVKGETRIPQRFDPEFVPFLRPNETLSDELGHRSLSFGNKCVDATLDDLRENERRNFERIEADPSQEPFLGPRLRIVVRYSNNLGQHFQSEWEAYLSVWNKEQGGGFKMPDRRENIEITPLNIPRPKFRASPETDAEMIAAMRAFEKRRDLSGW
jgi:hypothetical protein